MQIYLWATFFGIAQGSISGPRFIIPWVVVIAIALSVLVSVTRFGSLLDILAELVFAFLLLAVLFSTLYWNYGSAANFSERLTRLDAVYFTVGTLTTAGTGNITATSETARGLQILQMVFGLILVVFIAALVIAELSSRIKKGANRVDSPLSSR